MAIRSNLEKHTISWLKRQDIGGKLNKNISIQRKEVWDSEKKSNLIVSLLLDIPVESLLFEEVEDGSYNVLDGKQRTLALCSFLDGSFPLSPKIRIKVLEGIDLVKQTFSSLPNFMKERILEYELSISILRPLDVEERATVFFMRNQAVSLSKMDLSLVMLGQEAMSNFSKLCDHNFMMNKIKLTTPARRKREDLGILLQYLILHKRPEFGFSGKEIMRFCDEIKNGDVEISYNEVEDMLNYLDKSFPMKMQYLKKVHVPIVMHVARDAKSEGMEPEEFRRCIDAFFVELDSDGEYMATCMAGSSKRSNVLARVRIMGEWIDQKEISQRMGDVLSSLVQRIGAPGIG